ncbi:30S ribosome-binding factor RbfA [Caviibacter abscessus]|uniref:30S ribosome-binding factor RbfA n=1 Tax=Caviibacter abscessus TaxID=1766719 RepID=UPI0008329DED|nr:30S ribosome-binding factor RbfA [Caviibacter abscessus]
MNDRRLKGLEKEISRIIGTCLLIDVKNEKISKLVTVHNVKLTKDARYVDITFSILNINDNINKSKIEEDLRKLAGFFRKKLSENLEIRYIPEVRIHIDESVEYGIKIASLIDKVMENK